MLIFSRTSGKASPKMSTTTSTVGKSQKIKPSLFLSCFLFVLLSFAYYPIYELYLFELILMWNVDLEQKPRGVGSTYTTLVMCEWEGRGKGSYVTRTLGIELGSFFPSVWSYNIECVTQSVTLRHIAGWVLLLDITRGILSSFFVHRHQSSGENGSILG